MAARGEAALRDLGDVGCVPSFHGEEQAGPAAVHADGPAEKAVSFPLTGTHSLRAVPTGMSMPPLPAQASGRPGARSPVGAPGFREIPAVHFLR